MAKSIAVRLDSEGSSLSLFRLDRDITAERQIAAWIEENVKKGWVPAGTERSARG